MLGSVIIPIYNGAATLERTILGFLAQEVAKPHGFELILYDDGSRDESRAILRRYSHKKRIKVILAENRGQSAASNAAAAQAQGEVVLFSAQDIVPAHSRFIEGHLQAHGHGSEDRVVTGYIKYPPELITTDFMRCLRDGNYQFNYQGIADPGNVDPLGLYAPNFSVKREHFRQAGGFDEAFRYGYQDLDLGIRFSRAGLKIILLPHLDCFHLHSHTFEDFCLRVRQLGKSYLAFYQKNQYYFVHLRKIFLMENLHEFLKQVTRRLLFERILREVHFCRDSADMPIEDMYLEYAQQIRPLPPLPEEPQQRRETLMLFYFSVYLDFCVAQVVVAQAMDKGLLPQMPLDTSPIYL